MYGNKTLVVYQCVPRSSVTLASILALIGLPVNLLIFKILIKVSRLRSPRHKILLSLTISDGLQILLVALIYLISFFLGLKTSSITCQELRKAVVGTGILTMFTSSGSILALSFERYIACIHCFRLHQIISESRVDRFLWATWILGVILAISDEKRYKANLSPSVFHLTIANKILYSSTVISNTIILVYIQARLYKLSRKLTKVNPGTGRSFGSSAEANDLRRNQLKVSLVASAVIFLYVVCTSPMAVYIIVSSINGKNNEIQIGVFFLVQLNAFFDPFVYGFGMKDTRTAITRELREAKMTLHRTVDC